MAMSVANAVDGMRAGLTPQNTLQNQEAMNIHEKGAFSVNNSGSSLQMMRNYQDVDVASSGAYGTALRRNAKSRGTAVQMMAGGGDSKSPFMDFKIGMLDDLINTHGGDTGEKSMGELCKDKKAILLVNVASE